MKNSSDLVLKQTRKDILKIDLTPEMENLIKECKEKGRLYGVFPTVGDSMTCNDNVKSIPSGSKVFAVETDYRSNELSLGFVPNNKPLLIMGQDPNGKPFAVCKTIALQDYVSNRFLLRSYNPFHIDAWVPIKWVHKIFEVKQIVTL